MRFTLTALITLLTVGLTACDLEEFGPSSRYKEDFHQSFPLKAGGRLHLENFNGSVEISGWDQETADISGTKYAATEELLAALKIDIVPASDSIQIRTARPSDRRGSMGAKYVIRVPRRTELERVASSNGSIRITDIQGASRLRTSNGAVRALNLRGDMEVRTSNGSVEVTDYEGRAIIETSNGRVNADHVRGSLDATTSNGGIRAIIEKPEPKRPMKLGTSNGGVELVMQSVSDNPLHVSTSNSSIALRLPDTAGVRVKASTSNGSVSSDFDLKQEGVRSRTRMEGVVGSGGPLVELSTSNGSIRLQRLTD